MSVIIRLQNLPWAANSLDIRFFFKGLSIPEGGVHIVGGENGDAFIAFSSDEDARQAMMMSGGKLKESQVTLLLSSRAEMQKVIETARQKALSFMQLTQQPALATLAIPTPVPAPVPAAIQPPIISMPSYITQNLVQPVSTMGLTASTVDMSSFGLTHAAALNVNGATPKVLTSNYNLVTNKDNKLEREDSKEKTDRRGRGRRTRSRSRSRSRERRRSRDHSRDRSSGSSRRRRERSRSRSRERRRYRRSRSRSPVRNSRNTRERVSRFSNRTSPIKSSLDSNGINSIWCKMPSSMIGSNPNATPVFNSSMSNIGLSTPILAQGGETLLNQYPLKNLNNVYSTQDTEKKPELDTNRNTTPFQSVNTITNPTSILPNKSNEVWNLMDAANPISNAPCCVSIANMDPITGYGEIRRFFQGLFINNNGIKMLNDSQGRRTGTAYVKFARDDSVAKAVEQTGRFLKQCAVEVVPIPDEKFEEAVDSFKPNRSSYSNNSSRNDNGNDDDSNSRSRSIDDDKSSDHDDKDNNNDGEGGNNDDDDDVKIVSVQTFEDKIVNSPNATLLINNIPTYAKEQDFLHTFSNYSLLDVNIDKNPESKLMQAIVKFNSADDAQLVLNNKANYRVLNKDVEISLYVEKAEADDDDDDVEYVPKSTSSSDRNYSNGGGSRDPRTYMRSSSNEQRPRVSRFSDIRPRNNPDPKNINNTEITDSECVVLKNLEDSIQDSDVIAFFSDIGVAPIKVHMLLTTHGKPSGDCFCEFSTCEEAEKALRKNNNYLGNKVVLISSVARRKVDYVLNSFKGGLQRDNNGGNNYRNNRNDNFNNGNRGGFNGNGNNNDNRANFPLNNGNIVPLNPENNPDSFGKPGCVINMANVPYRAGVDDIIKFYKGYNISQQNVIRRYNDLGQPTGDARVCFSSAADAQRAFNSYHQNKIHGRTVFLSIV